MSINVLIYNTKARVFLCFSNSSVTGPLLRIYARAKDKRTTNCTGIPTLCNTSYTQNCVTENTHLPVLLSSLDTPVKLGLLKQLIYSIYSIKKSFKLIISILRQGRLKVLQHVYLKRLLNIFHYFLYLLF